MAAPPSGRPPQVRSGREPARGLPPLPPLPARPPARSRTPGTLAPRPAPPGPRGPVEPRRTRRPRGRLRRFAARWGWRAYAIPLLTVATVLALADLLGPAAGSPARVGATAGDATPAARSPEAAPPASTAPPTTAPPPAEGDAGPAEVPGAPATGTYVEQGAGSVSVVPGVSAVYGSGPLQRFVVEVEDGIGVDGAAFAAAVEATLGDPRSWGSGGRMSFQRVDATDAGAYEFRVSLVSPGSMERYCPGVGTGGYTSCRYGERAVINLARWETAVPHYDGDIATYRQYVVNHEVGHALGNGHQPCPGAGQVAPVMQQQTLGLDGCVKNAWPYP
ncbi:hypothetical protein GCM10027451_24720 [Geodermatophilus aquaeductus]|uniref:DUF3152 domain-containing protein n=1 Tax=Geodermatophilus aquaeductus TaxID=1564161 RepID=A0A521END7_9ACTN|nr:DUF3152 domain-containing protein [Geodermatophilus aquaeductus]SMO85439.1 Protein of unknown function [Geodermatophilus aquaeductus]